MAIFGAVLLLANLVTVDSVSAAPPAPGPTIRLHTIPTPDSRPAGITRGPDGHLWFTESAANKIGELDPSTGAITEYPIPTADSEPTAITAGAFGRVWFTERAANKIGELDPSTGTITEYPIPTADSQPDGIARDSGNGHLWFTQPGAAKIGKLNPLTGGTITEFGPIAGGVSPRAIDATSGLWFAGDANTIVRLDDPDTLTLSEYPIPTPNSDPVELIPGLDGNLWFTENAANQVAKITPTGTITEYPIPTAASSPSGITVGPDGNLWFTELAANQIARVTTSGDITEYPIPEQSGPISITTGPNGNLWFAGWDGNNIGELIPAPTKRPVRCAGGTFENAGVILNTINADLLVNGPCSLGIGARINGDVKVVRGGNLFMYDGATVHGDVRAKGGRFDTRVATVTGDIDVKNVPDGYGVGIIFTDVGGSVTIRNVPGGFFILGSFPEIGAGEWTIAGNVTISNVGPIDSQAEYVFDGYTVGGDVKLRNVAAGSGRLINNTVAGDLTCHRVLGLASWTVQDNTVGGTDTCAPA